jgi:hypothetical protein
MYKCAGNVFSSAICICTNKSHRFLFALTNLITTDEVTRVDVIFYVHKTVDRKLISVADPDPGSGAFWTPGSGSGMNIPDHVS